MEFTNETETNTCKYCNVITENAFDDSLQCSSCEQFVHTKCLRRGAVPGGLMGDVFFQFTCQECSDSDLEVFIRDRMPWLQAILLVLYHMQIRSAGLAKKGFFHWKVHIATFIDRNWDLLFRKDFKRKKKWIGTVSGTLSHYSPHFFKSGTALLNEPGWWALTYPKFTPFIIIQLNGELMIEKQKAKELKLVSDDSQLLRGILATKRYVTEELLNTTVPETVIPSTQTINSNPALPQSINTKPRVDKKKRLLLPTLESLSSQPTKKFKYKHNFTKSKTRDEVTVKPQSVAEKESIDVVKNSTKTGDSINVNTSISKPIGKPPKFLDPLCHYNTSLNDISQKAALTMRARLMGGIRKEPILSPYSSIHLPPYIRRDTSIRPSWLQLMDELKAKVNQNNPKCELPKRSPIDFAYVQPEHIPAINSLCNQFFWTGIDLADTLKYPDFSCIVLYRKLIIGFAFIVPDVKISETYLSFIFTRPGWRNCGIAKFMLYHLIQTSIGRDITLHVSISNSALFLYQKFGFKVENVVLDFYNQYMRDDTRESKHAFFCRLER